MIAAIETAAKDIAAGIMNNCGLETMTVSVYCTRSKKLHKLYCHPEILPIWVGLTVCCKRTVSERSNIHRPTLLKAIPPNNKAELVPLLSVPAKAMAKTTGIKARTSDHKDHNPVRTMPIRLDKIGIK